MILHLPNKLKVNLKRLLVLGNLLETHHTRTSLDVTLKMIPKNRAGNGMYGRGHVIGLRGRYRDENV